MDRVVSQIKRILAGGDVPDDFPWTDAEIRLSVSQALAYQTKMETFQGMSEGDRSLPDVMLSEYRPKDLEVKRDDEINQYYVDLPQPPVTFNGMGGIQHIGPIKNLSCSYKKAPNSSAPMRSMLHWVPLSGEISYYMQGSQRVMFENMEEETDLIARIYVSGGTDDVQVPEHMAISVVNYVVDMYRKKQPTDEVDDGSDQATR